MSAPRTRRNESGRVAVRGRASAALRRAGALLLGHRHQSPPRPLVHASYQHFLANNQARQLRVNEVFGGSNGASRFLLLTCVMRRFVEQRAEPSHHFCTDQMLVFTSQTLWQRELQLLENVLRCAPPWRGDSQRADRLRADWRQLRFVAISTTGAGGAQAAHRKLLAFSQGECDVAQVMNMVSRSFSCPRAAS